MQGNENLEDVSEEIENIKITSIEKSFSFDFHSH